MAIAEAAVRIVADTDSFDDELRREMLRSGRTAAEDFEVAFTRELRGLGRDVGRQISRELNAAVEASRPEVEVGADLTGFQAELRRELRRIRPVEIPVTLDAAVLDRELQALTGTTGGGISIPARLDTAQLRADLEAITASEIGELVVPARLDPTDVIAGAEALQGLQPQIDFEASLNATSLVAQVTALRALRGTIPIDIAVPPRASSDLSQIRDTVRGLIDNAGRLADRLNPLRGALGSVADRLKQWRRPAVDAGTAVDALQGVMRRLSGTLDQGGLAARALNFDITRNTIAYALAGRAAQAFNDRARNIGRTLSGVGTGLEGVTTRIGPLNALIGGLGRQVASMGDGLTQAGRRGEAFAFVLNGLGQAIDAANNPLGTAIRLAGGLEGIAEQAGAAIQRFGDRVPFAGRAVSIFGEEISRLSQLPLTEMVFKAHLDADEAIAEAEALQALEPQINVHADLNIKTLLAQLAVISRLRPTIDVAVNISKRAVANLVAGRQMLQNLAQPADSLRQRLFPVSTAFTAITQRLLQWNAPGRSTVRTMGALNSLLGAMAGSTGKVTVGARLMNSAFARNAITFLIVNRAAGLFDGSVKDIGSSLQGLAGILSRITTPLGPLNTLLRGAAGGLQDFGTEMRATGNSGQALRGTLTNLAAIFRFLNNPIQGLRRNAAGISSALQEAGATLRSFGESGGRAGAPIRALGDALISLDEAVVTPLGRIGTLRGVMASLRGAALSVGRGLRNPIQSLQRMGAAIADTQTAIDVRAAFGRYRTDLGEATAANNTFLQSLRGIATATGRFLKPAVLALKNFGVEQFRNRVRAAFENVTTIFRGAIRVVRDFGLSFAKFGATGIAALGAIGPAASAAVVGLLSVGQALGSAFGSIGVGALAAAPAALGLLTAAVKTFQVAAGSLGSVWNTALTANAEDYNKAMTVGAQLTDQYGNVLGTVTPAIRQTADEMRSLKDETEGLRGAVQTAFLSQLTGGFAALRTVIPAVRRGMTEVATEYGVIAQRALTFAGSNQSVVLVSTTFETLRRIMAGVAQGVSPVLEGLAAVATAGLSSFNGLGQGIAGAMTRFGAFLSQAAGSGQVTAWIQSALSAFRTLGGVLSDIGSILGSIFQAASTALGGLGGTLGSVTGQLAAFFRSAQGQDALVAVFEAIGAAAEQLGPLLSAAGGALAELAPTISQLVSVAGPALTRLLTGLGEGLDEIGPGLTTVFTALADALRDLAPALGPVGEALGAILSVVSPLITPLGRLASAALRPLARIVVDVAEALRPLLDALGEALSELEPLIVAFMDFASVALRPVIHALGLFASAIAFVLDLPIFSGIVQGLANAFDGLGFVLEKLFDFVRALISPLKSLGELLGLDFQDDVKLPELDTSAMNQSLVTLDENLQEIPASATRATDGFGDAMSTGIASGYRQGAAAMRTGTTNLTAGVKVSGERVQTQLQQTLETSIATAVQNAIRPLNEQLRKQLDGIKVNGKPQANLELDLGAFDGAGLSQNLSRELKQAYDAAFNAAREGNDTLVGEIQRQFANANPEVRAAVERGIGNGTQEGLRRSIEALRKNGGAEIDAVKQHFIELIGQQTGQVPIFRFENGQITGFDRWVPQSLLVGLAQGVQNADIAGLFGAEFAKKRPDVIDQLRTFWAGTISTIQVPEAAALPFSQAIEAATLRALRVGLERGLDPASVAGFARSFNLFRGAVIAELNKNGVIRPADVSAFGNQVRKVFELVPESLAPGGQFGLSMDAAFTNLQTSISQGLRKAGASLSSEDQLGLARFISDQVAAAKQGIQDGSFNLDFALNQLVVLIGGRLKDLGIDPAAAGLNLQNILTQMLGIGFGGAAAKVPGEVSKLTQGLSGAAPNAADLSGFSQGLQNGINGASQSAFQGAAGQVPLAAAPYMNAFDSLGTSATGLGAGSAFQTGIQNAVYTSTSSAFTNAAAQVPFAASPYTTAFAAIPATLSGPASPFATGMATNMQTATTNAMTQGAMGLQQGQATWVPQFTAMAQAPNTYLTPLGTNIASQTTNAMFKGNSALQTGKNTFDTTLQQMGQSPMTRLAQLGGNMRSAITSGMTTGQGAAERGTQNTAAEIGQLPGDAIRALAGMGQALANFFADAMQLAINAVSNAAGIIAGILNSISGRISSLNSQINSTRANASNLPAGAANGAIITRDQVIRVGEQNKPEVIIPLTKPARARQLAEQSGLMDLLARTGGVGGRGTTVTNHITMNTAATQPEVIAAHLAGTLARRLRTQ
ncbi:hypothetical protein [Streptomyces hydrogenans]|uniref:hypothetical protein n=1 Tax=Streptomyces hydrogenans TaxID=1873719 RepID=UPI00380ACD42